VRDARVSGRGIQPGLVRLPRAHCPLHFIIDFQDNPLGSVFSVFIFVFTLYYGEGIHNVIYIWTINAIEVEEAGIKFTADKKTALYIPAKGIASVTEVRSERLKVI
jgi:hypothetical protein